MAVRYADLFFEFYFGKLFGSDPFVFVKCLDKVTFVIKTTGDSHFLDGDVLGGKHLTGAFNPVIIQIVDGCPLGHAAEVTAEIFRVHACDLCQHVKTDVIIIIFGDIGKHTFHGV